VGVVQVWHGWEREVERWLPELGVRGRRVLGLLSLGMVLGETCSLAKAASRVLPVGPASAPSTERRFGRFLANDRIDVPPLRSAVARRLLADAGETVWLALDETSQGKRHRPHPARADETVHESATKMLSVRLLHRRRAVPLVWAVHPPGTQAAPYGELIAALLAEVAACVPPGARVVLLADRGLAWPGLIHTCGALGWSYLLRLQTQTRIRVGDAADQPAASFAPRPGCRWAGTVAAFKGEGWLAGNLVAVWRRGSKERWLLFTDLPAAWQRTIEYRRRTWEEESFRDDKSAGFDWEQSRIRDPAHMSRLLLAMQLATLFVLAAGRHVLKRGLQRRFTRTDQRDLSLFSLGLRFLAALALSDHAPLPSLTRLRR
jgi:hypothetical protein